MKSISKRIMLSIFICTFLLATFIMLVFNSLGNKLIFTEMDEKIRLFRESQISQVNGLFHDTEQSVESLSALFTEGLDLVKFKSDPVYAKAYIEEKKNLLLNFANNDNTIMSIYAYIDPKQTERLDALWMVKNMESNTFEQSFDLGEVADFTPDNPDLEWFYGPLQTKGIYWTPIYEDVDLKIKMISCIYPLVIKGEIIGVIGVDISNFDVFAELMKDMKIGNSGFAAMIDSDGRVLSHPEMPLETNFAEAYEGRYKSLYEDMKNIGEGSFRYSENNQKHYVSYAKASNGKYFYIDMLENEIYGKLNDLKKTMTVILLIGILCALAASYFLGKSIGKPLIILKEAANRLAVGDVAVELPIHGEDETAMLTEAFNRMANSIKEQVHIAESIAAGNLEIDIYVRSDKDLLGLKLNEMKEAISRLVADTKELAEAAVAGRLETRVDVTKHGGEYRKIVDGFNQTLDAVIIPLRKASHHVDEISKGRVPERITESYNGDFDAFKNSLNGCIDAMTNLIEDTEMLCRAGLKGELSVRVDATRHGGDFKTIIEGFNGTLDAVTLPVREATSVLEQLAEGNLTARVSGNYLGDHAAIKIALNKTLDALNAYISEINRVLFEMSDGNLNVHVEGAYAGDFAAIKIALEKILESFNHVLSDISASVELVSRGAGQIANGSAELSLGSSEQSSAINDLTTAMESIASQANENSESASQANLFAVNTKKNILDANKRMDDMLNAMSEIKMASNNIGSIIRNINEIAMQTNVLAINAAIEAARAGEHGKGFAVVAEEVIGLATRSANAARETGELVHETINKVEEGVMTAGASAGALNRIVSDVGSSVELLDLIAEASNEQSNSIERINLGISQVSRVAHNNASAAEESAAAGAELTEQADHLRAIVEQFRLRN